MYEVITVVTLRDLKIQVRSLQHRIHASEPTECGSAKWHPLFCITDQSISSIRIVCASEGEEAIMAAVPMAVQATEVDWEMEGAWERDEAMKKIAKWDPGSETYRAWWISY